MGYSDWYCRRRRISWRARSTSWLASRTWKAEQPLGPSITALEAPVPWVCAIGSNPANLPVRGAFPDLMGRAAERSGFAIYVAARPRPATHVGAVSVSAATVSAASVESDGQGPGPMIRPPTASTRWQRRPNQIVSDPRASEKGRSLEGTAAMDTPKTPKYPEPEPNHGGMSQ